MAGRTKTLRIPKYKGLWLALLSSLALTAFVFKARKISHTSVAEGERTSREENASRSSGEDMSSSPREGNYNILQVDNKNVEYIYEFDTSKETKNLEAIIFLAHGCGHSAKDWWPVSKKCAKCVGLPIERRIVSEILESHHWLAVAISSGGKCWSSNDIDQAVAVIDNIRNTFFQENKNQDIPVYGLGASSGGHFVSELALSGKIDLSAVVVQIMPAHLVHPNHPPIVFNYMPRDKHTADIIHSQINAFHKTETDGKSTPVNVLEIKSMPRKIFPQFFYEYIPEIVSESQSSDIYKALEHAGYLDESSKLKKDPRASDWRNIVGKIIPKNKDSLKVDDSAISELMNVAWAKHEITDYRLKETIDFLVQYNLKK